MCDPATAMLALSIGSSAAGYMQQQQQHAYTSALAVQQSESAAQSMIDQTKQLGIREAQEEAATAMEMCNNAVQGAEARGRAIVSAGEAGVAGLSVDALLRDFYQQEANQAETMRYNSHMQKQQAEAERLGLVAQAEGRMQDAASRVTQAPSMLGLAANVGTQTLGWGMKYRGWGKSK